MKIKIYFVIFFLFLICSSEAAEINVAILWHQHQPDYKSEGIYQAPWVRLHAIKDYVDMISIIEKYPQIKVNVNLVPSLLAQIEDYVYNDAEDVFTILMQKNPDNLTFEEKKFILERSFDISWKNVIPEHPVYYKFLKKRGKENFSVDEEIISRFGSQEFRDLMVWFNLAWFDSDFYSEIEKFFKKQKNFSDNDIQHLLDIQKNIMAQIIPLHRNMQERGRIEITTTPYYHPILPLLYDSNVAEISYNGINLPEKYAYPENAKKHVDNAVSFHKERFRKAPGGMWPAEGSVSKDIIDIITLAQISWIATGDEVLSKSINKSFTRNNFNIPDNAKNLYKPYIVKGNNSEIFMVFRDGQLSDKLGFEYANITPEEAIEDFKSVLYGIRKEVPENEEVLITIILDGENAWENYKNDAKDFFHHFYTFLSQDPNVETVLISDYLKRTQNFGYIENLWPGSWINGDFAIWIGEEEENNAWEYLLEAVELWKRKKDFLDLNTNYKIEKLIMKAEGSDWFWWFGKDQNSGNDLFFDEMFRNTLKKIYYLLGEKYPHSLDSPLIALENKNEKKLEKYFLPTVDGQLEEDWEKASIVYNVKNSSVMRKVGQSVVSFRFITWEGLLYYLVEFDKHIDVSDVENMFLLTEKIKIPLKETFHKINQNIIEGVLGENPSRIKFLYSTDADINLPQNNFADVNYSYREGIESRIYFKDASDDDYGPGTYTYPSNQAFLTNSFDFTFFELCEDASNYYFITGIKKIDNVWNSPVGLSVQSVDIYINTGKNNKVTPLAEDRNAYALGQYNYFINVEGWHKELIVYNDMGKEISKTNALTAFVDVVTGDFVVKVSKEFFKTPLDKAGFIVAMLGQDGSKPSRIRPVTHKKTEWTFGGGNKINTNIIDLIDTGRQKEILSGKKEIPYLKAVSK